MTEKFEHYICDTCGHSANDHYDLENHCLQHECECTRFMPRYVGKPKRSRSDKALIYFRCKPEVYTALKQAADDRDVSMTWLINKACEDFIDRLLPAEEWRLTRD